jgi:hypothetical protein
MFNHHQDTILRLLKHGLLISAGVLLLNGCASQQDGPYAVVEEEAPEPEVITVQAKTTEQPPRETIVYEPEHPQSYIVREVIHYGIFPLTFLKTPGIGRKSGTKTLRLKIPI